jgi:nucleoid-associated protein YgaU
VLQGPGAGAPAATSPNAAAAIAANHIVVQPGQTLWRIARHAYGEGMRYTVIFEANRDHITDPALIFPGQTFALPRAP